MFLIILSFISDLFSWKIPTVFSYCSTRMILGALTSLFMTLVLGPKMISLLYNLKTGQTIRVENCPMLAKLHEKKKQTPSMGGVLILLAVLVSLVLWMDLSCIFTLILLIATLGLGLIGGIDDYLKMKYKNSKGLSSKKKFLAQIFLAVLAAVYLLKPVEPSVEKKQFFSPPQAKWIDGQTLSLQKYQSLYFLPFVKYPVLILSGWGLLLAGFFILFVITGSSNAVNLTDGLDGLAAGLVLMSAGVLAVVAFLSNHLSLAQYLNILYIESSSEIAVFLSSIFGACLGFLWYNGHPAQIFMGDVGSLPLGGVLGLCSILLRKECLFAIVGGIFVVEALSVMIQVTSYKWRKKRVFLCSPIHHHFEYKGWPETKIVIRFWIIGLILALVGFVSLKFQ